MYLYKNNISIRFSDIAKRKKNIYKIKKINNCLLSSVHADANDIIYNNQYNEFSQVTGVGVFFFIIIVLYKSLHPLLPFSIVHDITMSGD